MPGSTSRSIRSRAVSFPARAMSLDGLLAAAGRDERGALAELGDEPLHRRASALERLVACDLGREHRHRRLSLPRLLAGGRPANHDDAVGDEPLALHPVEGERRLDEVAVAR